MLEQFQFVVSNTCRVSSVKLSKFLSAPPPHEDAMLPIMVAKAQKQYKGTILLHGGKDLCFEEMFLPMLYLSEHGYDVYLFEGLGQGNVLRVQVKHFTYAFYRVLLNNSHQTWYHFL